MRQAKVAGEHPHPFASALRSGPCVGTTCLTEYEYGGGARCVGLRTAERGVTGREANWAADFTSLLDVSLSLGCCVGHGGRVGSQRE